MGNLEAFSFPAALREASGLRLVALDRARGETLAVVFAAMEPWSRYPFGSAALARYLMAVEAGAPRLQIMHGTDVIGALGLRLCWLRGPYIQFLGVIPEAQGLGFGREVVNWVISEAERGGERNVWVAASQFNTRALGFYECAGFSRVAELDGLVQEDVTEVLLRKRILTCG